jgi:CDP-4-dehydro-6-deoxyglucose reductase, E3
MKSKNKEVVDQEIVIKNWHGIPRSEILWHPNIDYEKCSSCGKCVNYCTFGTFELQEDEGKKKPVVSYPNNCVVLCSGCNSICAVGAITHPSKKQTLELIRELRKTYPLQREL